MRMVFSKNMEIFLLEFWNNFFYRTARSIRATNALKKSKKYRLDPDLYWDEDPDSGGQKSAEIECF
jgi:hypothetical protein